MDRVICVFNPQSAAGTVGRRWPTLHRAIERAGLACDVVHLDGSPLLEGLGESLAKGPVQAVIGIGGDGTHFSVINALKTLERQGRQLPPYVSVPCGTGNDVAKSLGIDFRRAERSVGLVTGGESVGLDLGTFGERFFADAVCIGVDAQILEAREALIERLGRVPLLRRFRPGFLPYALASLAALRAPRWPVEVHVDGELFYAGPAACLVLNNTRIHAGIFDVTPQARYDDGRLDLAVFPSLAHYIVGYALGFRWTPGWFRRFGDGARRTQGRHFDIRLAQPAPVQMDGELIGELDQLALGVSAGAIVMNVPRHPDPVSAYTTQGAAAPG